MIIKNILTLVIISGFFLISCSDKKKTADDSLTNQQDIEQKSTINPAFLIGSWEDQTESALHFSLHADGTANSDNMATLLYQKWQVKDNQRYLTAKSIGNRTSFIDTEVYEIQKLDKDQMILVSNKLVLKYKKIKKTN